MLRGKEVAKLVGAFVALLTVVLVVFAAAPDAVRAEDEVGNYVAKAKADAERARADAEKAMAEAEKAIAEADRAIAQAERAKQEAKGEKAKALEKMVRAHQYPDDIAMTSADQKTTAVFSHKKHTQREKLSCIECHPRVFIMKVGKNVVKKGHLSMAEMQKGKYCGNCHNGHKAFSVTDISSCKRCHPKSR